MHVEKARRIRMGKKKRKITVERFFKMRFQDNIPCYHNPCFHWTHDHQENSPLPLARWSTSQASWYSRARSQTGLRRMGIQTWVMWDYWRRRERRMLRRELKHFPWSPCTLWTTMISEERGKITKIGGKNRMQYLIPLGLNMEFKFPTCYDAWMFRAECYSIWNL